MMEELCARAGLRGLLIGRTQPLRVRGTSGRRCPGSLRRGRLVDALADADAFEVVAAPAVGRGIAAGGVVHPLLAAAHRAQPEVLRQEAIAALLALEQHVFEGLFAAVEESVDRPFAPVGPEGRHRLSERMKARVLGVQKGPMREVEEPLPERRTRRFQRSSRARLIVEIERFLRRPGEIVLELLPGPADLGGPLQDAKEHVEVRDAADIHAGGAEGPVHRHLLGRPLHVVVDLLRLDFGQQLITDEAAGQLAVVHQTRGRRQRAEQIHVAEHRRGQAGLLADT